MPFDPLADFDAEILRFLAAQGLQPETVQLSTPPEREFGERATNAPFQLARERRKSPRAIADEVAAAFEPETYRFVAAVEPAGAGFINFRLNYETFVPHAIDQIQSAGENFGRRGAGEQVVVEHTSVNPNKEWHIGHLRNAVLGDTVARLLRLAGHDVEVQNYIDDTGLQAAVSILALRDFPEPQRDGEKYDHYIGRLYVKITSELDAEAELRRRLADLEKEPVAAGNAPYRIDERTTVEARLANVDRLKSGIMRVMRELEAGEFHPIQQRLLDAQLQTAYRLGIYYDVLNWESNLVESGVLKDSMALVRTSPKVFVPEEGHYAGALVIDIGRAEDKFEVLIRSNGIPTYVGKDIAYHTWKLHILPDHLRYVIYAEQPNQQTLWSTALHGETRDVPPPDRIINVIAVHQSLAQQTVKEAIDAAGYPADAAKLIHLAYGMVSTAEGKISGRKGTGISADGVIDEAVRVAYERVQEKGQNLTEDEMRRIAESVGVGAVRYFMVQYNPTRDIVFDGGDVVSYDGNTGLYIQYALVRMFAILRRAYAEVGITDAELAGANTSILQHEQERKLIFHLATYPQLIADASRTLAVNLVAEFAYDLATIFSQFYRDCSVLNAEPALRAARLQLVLTTRDVLVSACNILGVPVIERL